MDKSEASQTKEKSIEKHLLFCALVKQTTNALEINGLLLWLAACPKLNGWEHHPFELSRRLAKWFSSGELVLPCFRFDESISFVALPSGFTKLLAATPSVEPRNI